MNIIVTRKIIFHLKLIKKVLKVNIIKINFSYLFLGIAHFFKLIITYERYYLTKLKKCRTNLQKLLDDNHLQFELPINAQLQNYLYRYKENS